MKTLLAIVLMVLAFAACEKEPISIDEPTPIEDTIPIPDTTNNDTLPKYHIISYLDPRGDTTLIIPTGDTVRNIRFINQLVGAPDSLFFRAGFNINVYEYSTGYWQLTSGLSGMPDPTFRSTKWQSGILCFSAIKVYAKAWAIVENDTIYGEEFIAYDDPLK